ncbi:hypothetical protein DSO57_1035196 [Entomophthora muscae]|uniref:Uncharacterized protein n=1 Tax=Entomophthora muscae TaxID=34485 RepID=A0ACC2TYB9_9FUNG|nr:hypothetical protein DSO57_1035196 [Entomophthora muscae]
MYFEALPWFVHDKIINSLDMGNVLTISRLSRYWRSRALRHLTCSISTRKLDRAPNFKQTMTRVARFIKEIDVYEDLFVLDPILAQCYKLNAIRICECKGKWPFMLKFFTRLEKIKKLHIDTALDTFGLLDVLFRFKFLTDICIAPVLSKDHLESLMRYLRKSEVRNLSVYVCLCSISCLNLVNKAAPSLVHFEIKCDHFINHHEAMDMHFHLLESFVLTINRACMAVFPFICQKIFPSLKRCSVSDGRLLNFGPSGLNEPLPGLQELTISLITTDFIKSLTYSYKSLSILRISIGGTSFYSAMLLLSNIKQVCQLTLYDIGSCDPILRLPTYSFCATHVTFSGIESHHYLAYNWIFKSFPRLQFLDMDFGCRTTQLFWPSDPALPILSATIFCLKARGKLATEELLDLCHALPCLKYIYFFSNQFAKMKTILHEAFPNLGCFMIENEPSL